LDINPNFARYLKEDGIKKIITQIQNIEYIDLAENAIKVFIKLILLILKNKYEDLYIVKINKGFGKNFF